MFCLNPVSTKNFFLIIVLFCLSSCMTPSESFARVATDLKYHQQIINAPLFQHIIFLNTAAVHDKNHETLHVYLDGDGTPWKNNRWLAKDPTSRNPLILNLMHQDKTPAILLGRPCYHGLSNTTECHSKFWTSHRYSAQVVDSMVTALNQWLEPRKYDQVFLIGYSGGGVLAVLLANKIPQLKSVITLAANLDVTEWSRYHGYRPLYNSLNPADSRLNSNIHQLHIAGTDDKVVPTYIIEQFSNNQVNASYILIPAQNHRCCWAKVWPDLLTLF